MDWSLPHPAARMPVLGTAAVATSQPLAAQAGLSVLADGGTAVDAAISAAAVLTVVEPTGNGLGSDAFALVWDGELHGLNGSGRAPRQLDRERFTEVPRHGWDAVTVPGAISAWGALHERFGRLPWGRLLEPAIRYATDGFVVSPGIATEWARAVSTFAGFREFQQTFAPGGRAPRAGQRVKLPGHAKTLRTLAEDGAGAFYGGAIGRWIGQCAQAAGSALHEDDFAAHETTWVKPLSVEFHGHELWELPPNGQGLAALQAVGLLREIGALELDPDSADGIHHQIEAMKLAFADAHRWIGDPDRVELDPASLLDPWYLGERSMDLDPARAGEPGHGLPPGKSTVYLCCADAEGRMVSFIQSNYEGFGSGVVVPFTGIALQNRAAGFTLERGHPNELGPGRRPFHTIIPAFLTRAGEPFAAFGVMGGPMQPQGHLQVALRMAVHGANPQAALDAPRWRVEPGTRVFMEPGLSTDGLRDLRIRGHRVELALGRSVLFGGGQVIARAEGGWVAGSDGRRDGQAVAL